MILSIIFFGTLVIASLLYWLIPRQSSRNIFLSLISLVFICFFDRYSSLLVIVVTFFTFFIGILIEKRRNKRFYFRTGIAGLLLILIGFKYLGLLSNILNSLTEFFGILPVFKIEKLLLPLGISYITFKYISYITDIYRKKIKPGSFFELLFYGSFFTIFVAGPIERFTAFKPQIEHKLNFSSKYIEMGFERMVIGLFKKLVVADWIGYLINPVWQNESDYSVWIRIVVLFGFSIQIYMDFSGYSDIAIGASKLFGITIMENFNFPIFKSNIGDFWKCWHISLSLWVRDYVYIPLGGSRHGLMRKNLNAIIAMIIFGIWHEATWGFLFWGVYHGLGISVFNYWREIKKNNFNVMRFCETSFMNYTGIILTFVFFSIGNLFFR